MRHPIAGLASLLSLALLLAPVAEAASPPAANGRIAFNRDVGGGINHVFVMGANGVKPGRPDARGRSQRTPRSHRTGASRSSAPRETRTSS